MDNFLPFSTVNDSDGDDILFCKFCGEICESKKIFKKHCCPKLQQKINKIYKEMSEFESGKTKLEKLNGEKRELQKDLKENDHIEKEEVKQKDGHVEDKQNVSFRRKVGRKGGNSCTRMKLDNRVKPDITGSGVRVEPDTSHVTQNSSSDINKGSSVTVEPVTSPVTQNLSSDMKGSGVRVELETSSTKNTPGRNESGCEPAKHSTRQEKMKNETNQDCIKETQMQDIEEMQREIQVQSELNETKSKMRVDIDSSPNKGKFKESYEEGCLVVESDLCGRREIQDKETSQCVSLEPQEKMQESELKLENECVSFEDLKSNTDKFTEIAPERKVDKAKIKKQHFRLRDSILCENCGYHVPEVHLCTGDDSFLMPEPQSMNFHSKLEDIISSNLMAADEKSKISVKTQEERSVGQYVVGNDIKTIVDASVVQGIYNDTGNPHLQSVNEPQRLPKVEEYNCIQCGETFQKNISKTIEEEIFSLGGHLYCTFRCEICSVLLSLKDKNRFGVTSFNLDDFTPLINKVDNTTSWCRICNENLTDFSQLIRLSHLLQHAKETQKQCVICTTSLPSSRVFKSHMKKHKILIHLTNFFRRVKPEIDMEKMIGQRLTIVQDQKRNHQSSDVTEKQRVILNLEGKSLLSTGCEPQMLNDHQNAQLSNMNIESNNNINNNPRLTEPLKNTNNKVNIENKRKNRSLDNAPFNSKRSRFDYTMPTPKVIGSGDKSRRNIVYMVDGHDIVQTSTTDRDVQNNLQLNREMNVNKASDNVNVHNLEVVSNNFRIHRNDDNVGIRGSNSAVEHHVAKGHTPLSNVIRNKNESQSCSLQTNQNFTDSSNLHGHGDMLFSQELPVTMNECMTYSAKGDNLSNVSHIREMSGQMLHCSETIEGPKSMTSFFDITEQRVHSTVTSKQPGETSLNRDMTGVQVYSSMKNNVSSRLPHINSVSGNAGILGNARISGNASISENANISGNADILGNVSISGNSGIPGNAYSISGNANIPGNAGILGQLTQTMETNDVSSSEVYYNMSKPGVPSMEFNDVSTTLAYINDVSTQNDIYKPSVQSSIPNNQVSSSLRIYDMSGKVDTSTSRQLRYSTKNAEVPSTVTYNNDKIASTLPLIPSSKSITHQNYGPFSFDTSKQTDVSGQVVQLVEPSNVSFNSDIGKELTHSCKSNQLLNTIDFVKNVGQTDMSTQPTQELPEASTVPGSVTYSISNMPMSIQLTQQLPEVNTVQGSVTYSISNMPGTVNSNIGYVNEGSNMSRQFVKLSEGSTVPHSLSLNENMSRQLVQSVNSQVPVTSSINYFNDMSGNKPSQHQQLYKIDQVTNNATCSDCSGMHEAADISIQSVQSSEPGKDFGDIDPNTSIRIPENMTEEEELAYLARFNTDNAPFQICSDNSDSSEDEVDEDASMSESENKPNIISKESENCENVEINANFDPGIDSGNCAFVQEVEISTVNNVKADMCNNRSRILNNMGSFQCDMCPLSFKREDLLVKHKALHLKNPYVCWDCFFTFSTSEKYNAHMKDFHIRH